MICLQLAGGADAEVFIFFLPRVFDIPCQAIPEQLKIKKERKRKAGEVAFKGMLHCNGYIRNIYVVM